MHVISSRIFLVFFSIHFHHQNKMYRIRGCRSIFQQLCKSRKQFNHHRKLPALYKTPILLYRNVASSIQTPLADANPISSCPGRGASDLHFEVGQRIHGYRVESIESVPELCLTAYRLIYEKNGAEHLHIARDDSNNVFGVTFRTTPEDSTGVAHILEHLALCGSRRYPVRDPFMKMLTRSLSTFMNAFTGCDYTMYPFSTQNPKDFYNLMSIYLDAVFYPRLRYLDFLQEGWRLEHSNVEDDKSPLIFKGVVFNEMKGVFVSIFLH